MSASVNNVGNFLDKHIKKYTSSQSYKTKALLAGAVSLDAIANTADAFKYLHDKNIPTKEERKYVFAYKLANGLITCSLQLAAGLTLASDKVQNFISKKVLNKVPEPEVQICKMGLQKALTIVGAVMLVKRLLVPLVVAPFANWIKGNLICKSKIYNQNNEGSVCKKDNYDIRYYTSPYSIRFRGLGSKNFDELKNKQFESFKGNKLNSFI